jgi:hypothetical protein
MRRAASMVASWPAAAKWTAEVDTRIKEPFPAARWLTWKWIAAARSQGMPLIRTSSVCRPMSLGSDAAHRWKSAPFQQRFRDQDGHLCVVGGLAGVPATASAHLATSAGRGEPRGERALGTELEGSAQGVTHR